MSFTTIIKRRARPMAKASLAMAKPRAVSDVRPTLHLKPEPSA